VAYWVVRVLLHQGRRVQLDLLTSASRASIQNEVDVGGYTMLADNSIAEPVEVFASEEEAHLHREVMRKRHPAEDFRVLLVGEALL